MTPNKPMTREEIVEGLKTYAGYFGGIHEKYCPEDDTCKCKTRWVNESIDQAIALLQEHSQPMSEELLLEKYIPEVYCDVYPACVKVVGYTKDGTMYNLEIENGKALAKALSRLALPQKEKG